MPNKFFTPSTNAQKKYWEVHTNSRPYNHEIVSFFAEQRVKYLAKWIDFSSIKYALEVGCGDGFASYPVSRKVETLLGGDISELCLERNPLPKDQLFLIDAKALPFSDNSFELCFCWEILHHVENPGDVICEMARVSKKYVVIFEPNRYNPAQFLFGLLKVEERGTLKSSLGRLSRYCASAGLKVIHRQNVGCLFPNSTPSMLFRILKHIPFVLPIIGISCILICVKND